MVSSSIKVPFPGETTVIPATQFPIKSVKLFDSESAEITRIFPLPFLHSQDEPQIAEIVHLPAGIQSVTVAVASASGNVTILDHYHASVSKGQRFGSTPPANQALRELQGERLRLQDERRLKLQSFEFLTTYMNSLAQCKSQGHPEAAQVVSFFDEFVEIGITRSAVVAELDGKLADIDGKIKEEIDRLVKLDDELPSKVTTVLLCNTQAPVETPQLTVTYVVNQVSWKAAYDLHVSMTGNTPSPTVKLDFRCTVAQRTGENWENVSLALTTADQVSQLIQLPEPKRIDINLGQTHAFPQWGFAQPSHFSTQAQPSAGQGSGVRNVEEERARERIPPSAVLFGQPQQPPAQGPFEDQTRGGSGVAASRDRPAFGAAPKVTGSSQKVSEFISRGSKDPITHVASGCVFIPSDNAAHHVLVASLSLQAEFMRVVVPNIDTRVYYTCEVKNTTDHVLLPGTVKAYLNDKHVSSTEIQSTELPQILECSLAIDTGVKTIHNRAPDALPSVTAFTGKATTTYTSATVIHNTHTEPIRGVIMRSSVPLPADPRITIVLKEPAGLAEIDDGNVAVKEGCFARWSTTGGRKGKQAGLFEWVCDVGPGTEVLRAVWEVCAPQDLKLIERDRS